MWSAEQGEPVVPVRNVRSCGTEHPCRGSGGAQSSQCVRHGFRVASRTEEPIDPGRRHRREEGRYVQPDDHGLPGVRRSECVGRAAPDESVRRRMGRDGAQHVGQDGSLERAQSWLGRLDEPAVEPQYR